MFNVLEIMKPEVVTVSEDTNIYEAMRVLVENKISGLPVVDQQGCLCGIVTEKDILCLLVNSDVSAEKNVADYMTKEVKTFAPNDSLIDIAEFFMIHPIRRVPIVENGVLRGIIARRDIIALIIKIRGKQ